MTPEVRERSIRSVTLWGALVNMGLTVFKLLAGIFGRSAAMVADGIHSLSDLLSDAVVLIFTHISSKGNDKGHSFGHGKFETFATMIVSLMLLIVGAGMMKNGINSIIDILNGNILPKPGWIAIAAAVVSIAAKEILYRVTARVGRKVDSPVVIANAWHHRSDAMSSIGSLVGIGGAMILGSKWTILDPLAACAISIAIIVVAVKMGLPSIEELLEASLPEDVEYEIRETASAVPGVRNIHALKTRRNGVSYIIDAHILVDPQISVVESHEIASQVENALSSRYGKETQVNIHVEPDIAGERMDI
ncbi:MAG: cation diffusion facilitator family transporter [Candidatus Cryptobacteroides sp.]|nr:cation diffusion facilitator family transporter [Rikenellaceae bacterium]MDY5746495.1 cation diffusion facilitator family transporter [Candidatus Cryptobacteroides sp.]